VFVGGVCWSGAPGTCAEIYRECGTFIVPGSHAAIWLVPEGR
jgi:hypothetical protein